MWCQHNWKKNGPAEKTTQKIREDSGAGLALLLCVEVLFTEMCMTKVTV